MHSAMVSQALALSGIAALVAIAIMICQRRLQRMYPIFLANAIYNATSSILLMCVQGHYRLYFYCFWPLTLGSLVLGFAAIYEIFKGVFEPYPSLKKLGNMLFRWAGFLLFMIAIVGAISGPHTSLFARFVTAFLMIDRSIRLMQIGMVVLLFLCSEQTGVTRAHRIFGIAVGFGISAAIDMISLLVLTGRGAGFAQTYDVIRLIAVLASYAIWVYYVVKPEPERVPRTQVQARTWDFALARTAPVGAQVSSFFPFIEGAVERAFTERSKRD